MRVPYGAPAAISFVLVAGVQAVPELPEVPPFEDLIQWGGHPAIIVLTYEVGRRVLNVVRRMEDRQRRILRKLGLPEDRTPEGLGPDA